MRGSEMEALIAGGAGFIGSHLAEKMGGEVFDLRTGQDGKNFSLVKKHVKGKDIVFHLANFPAHRLSFRNPHEIMHNNYLTTLNFAEACRLADVKMVFASSFGVYGKGPLPFREDSPLRPETPYGVAKKSCEDLLKTYHDLYGLDIIVVRPSNVWGERDYLHEPLQVLPLWINNVREGKEIVVYGERTTRDFTHISDFLEGMILASRQEGFEVFNIASGKETRLIDIARFLSKKVVVKPLPPYEVEQWRGDISKARKSLGWRPKKDFWKEFRKYSAERLRA
jgi:UDP-glucose 4-epimerase